MSRSHVTQDYIDRCTGCLVVAQFYEAERSSWQSPHKSYTMNINTVKTENGKVSCETAEGTVVHININQQSSLDCLLDTFRFFRDMRISGEKTMPSSTPACAAPLGFGVAYFSLGVVSVMLAIIFCVVPIDFGIFYSGAHFWVGFSFIVSGILNLVAYKFPKKFWMTAALISIVVNFSVSIGGMVVAVNDAQRLYWFGNEQVCDDLLEASIKYYNRTPPPRYYNGYNSYNYDLSTCKDTIQRSNLLQSCLIYMSLLIMIWGVCLAILYMACKVKSKSCCRSCKLERAEKDDELLKPHPSDDIIIA
ncbi:transmembrane protein 176B [Ranitomeya imitator]|uniref:transmembrane protein 176B n=1 Tax=Ranitomeya imitator TaxID=111125 RepID=UPI0037E8520D